ncbi:MAG: hypothetical protein ACYTGG_06095 [Planctomycetota bacterium]|jgi:hypothetical protein
MSDLIAPQQTVTFTIQKVPPRTADQKTLRRLMRMQPDVQLGLRKLARRRRQTDNITYIRAGVEWTNRKRTTKLTHLREGETFTLRLTPQIIPDLRSVEPYLAAQAAG